MGLPKAATFDRHDVKQTETADNTNAEAAEYGQNLRLGPGGLYANIVVGFLTVIVFSGSALAQGVASPVDVASGNIYWTEWNSSKLRRANLDGTGVEDFITGTTTPDHIAIDLTNSHIYWASDIHGAGKIKRANLDGTGVQDLITGLNAPLSIGLKLVASASSSSGEIRYVPFKSKYVLMALMAVLGGWLVLRQS